MTDGASLPSPNQGSIPPALFARAPMLCSFLSDTTDYSAWLMADFHSFGAASAAAFFSSRSPSMIRFRASILMITGGRRSSAGRGLASLVNRLERAYREFVVRDHVRFLLRCARRCSGGRSLLDIGCGSGTFLSVAHRHGFSACGMDQSPHAVAAAGNLQGIEVRQGEVGSGVWEGRRFDFVSMFHVLEHLPDPRTGLSYAAGLLRPGGSLLIQVPNVASVQARVFGRRWYGLDVPRHVVNFSPRALELLLREAGFRIQATARFSLRDNPASIASSLVPWLDPIGRHGRGRGRGTLVEAALEFAYFGMVHCHSFLRFSRVFSVAAAHYGYVQEKTRPDHRINRIKIPILKQKRFGRG